MSKTREEIAAEIVMKLVEAKNVSTAERAAEAFETIYAGVNRTLEKGR